MRRAEEAWRGFFHRPFGVCLFPGFLDMKPRVEIDFLFWKECPSHPEAWKRLQEALRELNIRADVRRVEVKTGEEARRLGFPGSPTIRVNGEDIDPKSTEGQPHRLTCRIYYDRKGKVTPVPPPDLIVLSLKKHQ